MKRLFEVRVYLNRGWFPAFVDAFAKYFTYIKQLKFNEDPDYDMLKTLFEDTYEENRYLDDMIFDWST